MSYEDFLDGLKRLKAAVEATPKGRVRSFFLGEPATDEDVERWQPLDETELSDEDDENGRADFAYLPDWLVEQARVADGAQLKWEVEVREGMVLSGWLDIPTLQELQENKSRALNEGDECWSLAPSAKYAEVVSACYGGDENIYMFCQNDCVLRASEIGWPSVLEAMLDALGMDGWETELYNEGWDEDDEEPFVPGQDDEAKAVLAKLRAAVAGNAA